MPKVETDAEVTVVVLIYRSLKWLDWVMEGVDSSKNETRYRWLVVANDATEEVRADPRVDVDWQNEDPDEFYINRVYRAWNEGVLNAPTSLVVLLNSDMWTADYWLDELMEIKGSLMTRARAITSPGEISWKQKCVPTSLLVESGRLPSAMPEYVKDFGKNPEEFDRKGFMAHATNLRIPCDTGEGKLYMPILVDRQEFMDIGGYPEGNPPGTTGDKDLIRRYAEAGFTHVTALGSVVYHVQCGEQEWP